MAAAGSRLLGRGGFLFVRRLGVLMNSCADQMPDLVEEHIGIASASCEITSGGVTTAATMNATTMK